MIFEIIKDNFIAFYLFFCFINIILLFTNEEHQNNDFSFMVFTISLSFLFTYLILMLYIMDAVHCYLLNHKNTNKLFIILTKKIFK